MIPHPRVHNLVYLPSQTHGNDTIVAPTMNVLGHTIGGWTLVSKQSCSDYGAYHFLSATVTGFFAYAVVPMECASPVDQFTRAASHEIVEAATDPAITLGWIDNSLGLPTPRLTAGEAADACGTFRIVNIFSVAQYWSSSDNGCRQWPRVRILPALLPCPSSPVLSCLFPH